MYRFYLVLYNVILHVVLFVASFYFMLKYKEGFSQRMGEINPPPKGGKRVWIHAVSVGEVVAASYLVERLKEIVVDGDVVLSTTTITGMKTIKGLNLPVDFAFYYPVDLPFAVRRSVDAVSPDVVIFVETELWPNIVEALSRKRVPLAMINGRLSTGSFRGYRWIKPLIGELLKRFSLLCMISSRDAWRVISLGAPPHRVKVMGNLKHGATIRRVGDSDISHIRQWLNVRQGEFVWVAGSTHKGEEDVILKVFRRLKFKYPEMLLVIVPRHPERGDEVFRLTCYYGFNAVKRSGIVKRNRDVDVVVVDTIGELFEIYGVATVVFCGGSLVPKGGQNIVEPAVWGKPIVHGVYMDDFALETEGLDGKGAFAVRDEDEMFSVIDGLLQDGKKREEIGRNAEAVVRQWATGVDECIVEIDKLLKGR